MILEDQVHSVYFDVQRHFGTLKFVHDPGLVLTLAKLDALGPDMLSDPPDVAVFMQRFEKHLNATLAEVLMDQSVVSGVDNYVNAESLYQARLSPHREVASLTQLEVTMLYKAINDVMKTSYVYGSPYYSPLGEDGVAKRRFAVYGCKQDPLGSGDNAPLDQHDVYTIKIGLNLKYDSFVTEADTGNKCLIVGLMLDVLKNLGKVSVRTLEELT